jgi:hypothetical protein
MYTHMNEYRYEVYVNTYIPDFKLQKVNENGLKFVINKCNN